MCLKVVALFSVLICSTHCLPTVYKYNENKILEPGKHHPPKQIPKKNYFQNRLTKRRSFYLPWRDPHISTRIAQLMLRSHQIWCQCRPRWFPCQSIKSAMDCTWCHLWRTKRWRNQKDPSHSWQVCSRFCNKKKTHYCYCFEATHPSTESCTTLLSFTDRMIVIFFIIFNNNKLFWFQHTARKKFWKKQNRQVTTFRLSNKWARTISTIESQKWNY
jgi:hypothetical protein